MTKGQRAMAACLVSKHSQRERAKRAGVSNAYIAKADLVVEFAPDKADLVLTGGDE